MTYTQDWCNIHTEPPEAEYSNFFGHWQEVMVMSVRWAEHVARAEVKGNVFSIVGGKTWTKGNATKTHE
jgi:hypothetical protein